VQPSLAHLRRYSDRLGMAAQPWIVAVMLAMPVATGNPAIAQVDSAQAWRDLTRDLEQLRQELAIPGMSVAVLVDQQVVYARGFGLADVDSEIAATESTPYQIGSLTKPFSAVLVMRLVEAELLTLDSSMRSSAW